MAHATSSATRAPSIHRNSKGPDQVLEWEETEYTKLPRGWSRFCRELEKFLQSIGLGIIMATFRGTFQDNYFEPKKVTIHRSRSTALFKSLIHVVPVGVALLEICLNLHGHYLGSAFHDQNSYQLIAKAHEILINASLSTIVLSYIRTQLMNKGLPFGAFLGGLQFLSVSYLWSRELWSSVFTARYLRQRISFLLLLTACGIIASTSGPSSATLLLPRLALSPVKPTYVLINGTIEDIWPDRLDPHAVPSHCSSVKQDQMKEDPLCPGANWYNLVLSVDPKDINDNSYGREGIGYLYDASGPGIQYTNAALADCPMDQSHSQVCGEVGSVKGVSAAFNNTLNWFFDGETSSFVDIYHTVNKDFYTAQTAIRCLSDVIVGPSDTSSLQFPRLVLTESDYQGAIKLFPVMNMTKADIYDNPGNNSEFELKWISLPDDDSITSGAVLLHPRGADINSTQNITACTLGAGWELPASIEPMYYHDSFAPIGYGAVKAFGAIYANVSGFAYPQRPIRMPPEWLTYLNPKSTLSDGTNITVINAYTSIFPSNLDPFQVAEILTYMLQGGLAISGWSLPWQELPNGPIQCTDCHILEVNHAYYGFTYNSGGTAIKLATAVMIAYCSLAVGHMIYLGSTGISSGSWDSAAEIVALAMNSAPTQHLQNTCSGIIGMKPFRTRVRILATRSTAGEEDHLELVFGEQAEAQGRGVNMEFNKEYGALKEERYSD